MAGDKETMNLFDDSGFQVTRKERKSPQTDAEKRLEEISRMESRDFQNLRNKLDRGKPLTAAEAGRLHDYRRKFESLAGADLPEHVVKSKNEVAEHFRKNVRTIIRWSKRGMPEVPAGYDLKAIEGWAYEAGLIETKSPEGSPEGPAEAGGPGKQHYETELKRLQAQLKQIELDKEMGKLIPVEQVEAGRVARVMAVKRALLAIPRGLAPLLTGVETREIEAILMEKMRELVTRFAGGELDGS